MSHNPYMSCPVWLEHFRVSPAASASVQTFVVTCSYAAVTCAAVIGLCAAAIGSCVAAVTGGTVLAGCGGS